jgi:hypothetical protein
MPGSNGDAPDEDVVRKLHALPPPAADPGAPQGEVVGVGGDAMFASLYGSQWQPSPFAYVVARGSAEGVPCVLLTIESNAGRLCFAMSDENAQQLARHLRQKANGIVLPGDN